MRHPLARALESAGFGIAEAAARLRVDPKTVRRWLTGRVPYPRNRAALVKLTGWAARDLWPELARPTVREPATEIGAIYPSYAAAPPDLWHKLFSTAETEIAIVAGRSLPPAVEAEIPHTLRPKAHSGVRVRIALDQASEVDSPIVFEQLSRDPAIEVRVHNTAMYNYIYRADDQVIVSPVVYAIPASKTPLLRLCCTSGDGLTATYLDSFERMWASARER